jgi:hypothetical protein
MVLGCNSLTLIIVEMRPACFQPKQLATAKFALVLHKFASAMTLYHHFLIGNCTFLSTAASYSAIVRYLHYKGPPDIDESDGIPSTYLVVVFATRVEEGQPSAGVDMLQTHKIYSAILTSWESAILVGKQWILMRCTIYV